MGGCQRNCSTLSPSRFGQPLKPARLLGLVGLHRIDYLTHDAPQIEAVYSMLEKLAGSRTLGSGQNANK